VAQQTEGSQLGDWLDKLAVQELIVRYSDAATRGAWDVFESLWTDDAVWEVNPPVGTRVVGAAAIRESVVGSVRDDDVLVQMTHGSVVTLLGDGRATATTTIHAVARRPGAHNFTNYAVYYDDLTKGADGAWRFARRRLQPIYVDPRELPGESPIRRPDLAELS
jgi:ketosteroid isomerase-like protein